MSSSRRKGSTPKKAHKVGISFTNWAMGGPLLSLTTTSSLGSRLSSKGSQKSIEIDTDDEDPPDLAPPAPDKVPRKKKKKECPTPEPKEAEKEKAVCGDCGPEPETGKCAPDCPICKEECVWEKHMNEKYGFMDCDACGRGVTWLKEELHRGHGEYACEKCTPDCTTCGRGPLWVSRKWQKTLKRRARKLQGLEKNKKDGDGKKDDDGKKDKGKDGEKKANEGDEDKQAKDKGKDSGKEKYWESEAEKKKQGEKDEKENTDKAGHKSAEKDNASASKESSDKKDEGGKGQKGASDWSPKQDAKLKEMKAQNKSWKDISSEVGHNNGQCKARLKIIEHQSDTTAEKKNETSGGDKQNANGAGEGDGFFAGFGDWNNDDSNKKSDDAIGGSGNNDGWGVPDTSNTNGDNSGGAANDSWGNNDNSGNSWDTNTGADANATTLGDNVNSGWGNNDTSNANASGGDQGTSGWDTNNTGGDTSNQSWDQPATANWNNGGDNSSSTWNQNDSIKTADQSGAANNGAQSSKSPNSNGKKAKNKNKGNNQDKKVEFEGQITEDNPTGYIPYKSAKADRGTARNIGSSPKTGNAEASGNSQNTTTDSWDTAPNTWNNGSGNAEASGSGWDAAGSNWATTDQQNGNGVKEPVRDCWAQPDLTKESETAGTTVPSTQPATEGNNGWFTVTDSDLNKPVNDKNAGMSWNQPQGVVNASQTSGNGAQSCGNQGKGGNNSNSNGFAQGFNDANFMAGGNGHFNSGNNGGGFNNPSSLPPSGDFNQGNHHRGKLQPTGAWSQDDCTKLEFLESKHNEHKWVQMQADFYNWTGRMIHHELIEMKFRSDGYDTSGSRKNLRFGNRDGN